MNDELNVLREDAVNVYQSFTRRQVVLDKETGDIVSIEDAWVSAEAKEHFERVQEEMNNRRNAAVY